MIVGPASDHRIQASNEAMGRTATMLPDDLLHPDRQRSDALPSGLYKELPVRIAPDVLAEEVEPFRDMRNLGLFR